MKPNGTKKVKEFDFVVTSKKQEKREEREAIEQATQDGEDLEYDFFDMYEELEDETLLFFVEEYEGYSVTWGSDLDAEVSA